MSATEASIEVTLRSSDGLDGLEERKFTLRPGMRMHIGRASKNTQKPELMMASDNAFIDSPVISREHAVLSTDNAPPAPSIYITDNGSMHGTLVNGDKLEPHRARKLSNGDLLQFGIDVTRNESFYIAHKYVFESSLPDNSFSHGFTVPDIESSDDEEIEVDDILSSPAPRYGTQTNPVTIDDTEDVQPEIIEIEEEEIVLHSEPVVTKAESEEDAPSSPPRQSVLRSPSPAHDEPAPARYGYIDGGSSDEADDRSIYSSEDEDSDNESNDSRLGSESGSDADPASDADGSDDEHNDDADVLRRMKMTAMLNHEQHKGTGRPGSPAHPTSTAPVALPTMHTPPTVQASHHQVFGTGEQLAPSTESKQPEPEFSPMNTYLNPVSMLEDTFGGDMFGSPSRPIGPKPVNWGVCDYSSPFTRDSNDVRMFGGNLPTANMFLQTSSDYAPDMFDRFTVHDVDSTRFRPYTTQHPQTYSDAPWRSVRTSPPAMAMSATATGVQTPPPASSSDIASPPQPRRTKVSIPEIVEDAPQQPPTPTSVTGSLKRKADVLDEEVEEDIKPLSGNFSEGTATNPSNSASTSVEERPKKRPRSNLGKAVKSMAAYLLPGAALAVGVLTQLPEDFWKP